MFWLKSGRFGDPSGGRRTKPVALGSGTSGTMGIDGLCPTAHAGKQAIVQVAITSTPRMEIHCQPSNIKMRRSEDFNRDYPIRSSQSRFGPVYPQWKFARNSYTG